MKKYQLVLRLENRYVILEEDEERRVPEMMLKWYEAHREFFNGTFEIIENN